MKILVKSFHPSIPNWPLECAEVSDDSTASEGQLLLSTEEYRDYLTAHQSEYDAWVESQRIPIVCAELCDKIAMEAQRRIIDITGATGVPVDKPEEWVPKQLNLQASFCYLLLKKMQGTSTSADDQSINQMLGLWQKVAAIRAYSASLQSRVNNGETVDIETGWPS